MKAELFKYARVFATVFAACAAIFWVASALLRLLGYDPGSIFYAALWVACGACFGLWINEEAE